MEVVAVGSDGKGGDLFLFLFLFLDRFHDALGGFCLFGGVCMCVFIVFLFFLVCLGLEMLFLGGGVWFDWTFFCVYGVFVLCVCFFSLCFVCGKLPIWVKSVVFFVCVCVCVRAFYSRLCTANSLLPCVLRSYLGDPFFLNQETCPT